MTNVDDPTTSDPIPLPTWPEVTDKTQLLVASRLTSDLWLWRGKAERWVGTIRKGLEGPPAAAARAATRLPAASIRRAEQAVSVLEARCAAVRLLGWPDAIWEPVTAKLRRQLEALKKRAARASKGPNP